MAVKRVEIIFNPAAGRSGRRAEDSQELVGSLSRLGVSAVARPTTGPSDATRLAREASQSGVDVIVSYGGDGTLNEVLQGIVGSDTALAVWAGGTANVVAKDLRMPESIDQLAGVIARGKSKRIALGVARRTHDKGSTDRDEKEQEMGNSTILQAEPRYFFMFAGIGLDASIARRVNAKLKKRTGQLAFWLEGLKHILTWRPEPFTIDVDGKKYSGVFALIANGKGYGGGLCMAPEAKLEEPSFEVYIVPRRTTNLAYLFDLLACARGTTERTDAEIVRGRHVVANSSHEPWVEVDGEVIGPLPMTFDVVADAQSIIVP
jgi:diacylglycerol kinase (ATP)